MKVVFPVYRAVADIVMENSTALVAMVYGGVLRRTIMAAPGTAP